MKNALASGKSVLFFRKLDDFVGRAFQYGTQLFQGVHGNGLIALEIRDGISAEAILINQGVGRDPTLLHGFPKRLVADHGCTPVLRCGYVHYLRKIAS